ncbi:MAG TPA: hypothetical protein VJ910_08875 [Desulfuromonadales bacterium]|nr:hypothetical protein [Desulfuromonadales bacterium]
MQEYQETRSYSPSTRAIDTLLYVVTVSAMLLLSISFLDWLSF